MSSFELSSRHMIKLQAFPSLPTFLFPRSPLPPPSSPPVLLARPMPSDGGACGSEKAGVKGYKVLGKLVISRGGDNRSWLVLLFAGRQCLGSLDSLDRHTRQVEIFPVADARGF